MTGTLCANAAIRLAAALGRPDLASAETVAQSARALPEDLADIAAALDGEDDAYARLVKRYEDRIASQMRRFSREPTVVTELVQDVFVEAYYSLKNYRAEAPFLHWLNRLATHVGYGFWRRRGREPEKVPLAEWDRAVNPDDPEAARQAADILYGLLARLTTEDRLVLTLQYFEDCGTREISARTGWSREVVKMRAMRARQRLRDLIEREGLEEELTWML